MLAGVFLILLVFSPILLVSIRIAASSRFILSVVYTDGRPSLWLVAHYDNDTVVEHAINLRQPNGSHTQPPT